MSRSGGGVKLGYGRWVGRGLRGMGSSSCYVNVTFVFIPPSRAFSSPSPLYPLCFSSPSSFLHFPFSSSVFILFLFSFTKRLMVRRNKRWWERSLDRQFFSNDHCTLRMSRQGHTDQHIFLGGGGDLSETAATVATTVIFF